MFCKKGQCEKCAHYISLSVEIGGKPSVIEICRFQAILDSLLRIEQGQIRIEASIESDRNEAVKWNRKATNIIRVGMLGLIYSIRGDEKGDEKIKLLLEAKK